MDKVITFCVPSFNSEAYMNKCIDSLLKGDHSKIEIIIVNDGSTDNTGAIADSYKEKYPDVVRVVHKENGGHGSGVNAGVNLATGLYYKVVDSDDWVDEESLQTLLTTMENNVSQGIIVDCYFTNFVFEHVNDNTQYVNSERNHFPVNKVFTFDEVKRQKTGEFIMMHSIIYKTEVIRESHTVLPEKTFYVDNLFVYAPMGYVNTMYYLDIDFYRYFIGRVDQSVNRQTMSKRYAQQLRVMKCMSEFYSLEQLKKMGKKKYRFMFHEFFVVSSLTLYFIYGDYHKQKGKDYHIYMKEFKKCNPGLYRKTKYGTILFFAYILIPPLRSLAAKIGNAIVSKQRRWGV